MKTLSISLALVGTLSADTQLNSWYTEDSSKYARIYETEADETALNSVTTWSRGTGTQSPATYSGVHEISSNTNWVYIRTTGLASHLMGPWYLNANKTNLFPNYPSNTATIYRIPRAPAEATTKTATGLGAVGYYVNGVAMFNSIDAFSYSTSNSADATPSSTYTGDDIWNRDAYVNENVTFDAANAHQAGNIYHYHASSPGLRHQLGDSVDYDASTNTYTENPAAVTVHSPILGWAADGYPVYGPYGYSTANNSSSSVTRMITGYAERTMTDRTALPQWAADITARSTTLDADEYGPAVSTAFPVGHYAEDYEFVGTGDLDLYNGRTCVTPEYPGGTYAYFITIEADGTPVYPYSLATQYYGVATGAIMTGVPGNVTVHFQGGPESTDTNGPITNDDSNGDGDLIITWSTIEGGTYTVQSSTTLGDNSWIDEALDISPSSNILTYITPTDLDKEFFRIDRTSIDEFDDNGFDYDDTIIDADPQNNILFLIIDDWGIDASLFDNDSTDTNISFAPMPNLQALVDQGLRFTNAYANPTCSVTRGSIITGRHPFRTGIGNPTTDNTLVASELALPEVFTAQASPYALGSFGKWHLGGGTNAPATRGGWTEFRGILSGGVDSYTDWSKTINGVTAATNVTTYTTTDQVDDTVSFITSQGTAPWFAWVGFNAPHSPFHNPANGADGNPLESYPEYPETNGEVVGTDRKAAYQAALEALDTEIGRLLASVDLNTTNIIIIGDNGTPAQTVQTPYDSTHAKGSLFEGGTHVPLIVAGPAVTTTGTTDTLVHCTDLYSTILDLAGIDSAVATSGLTIDSQSIVPILNNTDTTDRCVIIEQFGDDVSNGRAIISDDYPAFKLIIEGSPTDVTDTPEFLLYRISTDENEQSPLDLTNLSTNQQAAYDHLLAKDAALGGGYSDPASN